MSEAGKAERRHVLHGDVWQRGVLQEDAQARGALADRFDKPARATFAMRLAGPAGRWSLRIEAATAASARTAAGFDLAQPINTLRETPATDPANALAGSRLSARLGPDEWLLIEDGERDETRARLQSDLAGLQHALVDVSHRTVAIEIAGKRAPDVLNTGSALDLADQAFPCGTATRTLFAKAEIVLMRRAGDDQAPLYRLECPRSMARYLFAHLLDSAVLLGVSRTD